ncbi:SCO5717 family growth-regulating ATPase [Streptomyces himastatinicus]|uniref:SCO5717 family growth-regulating ATPase n=1 Tax=Streptomyces himastatinicus TaxID=998084 RepID=UPI0012B695EB|nr:SCO5717 family growth-regulating ATPase [Streptomyces himastatinicus]
MASDRDLIKVDWSDLQEDHEFDDFEDDFEIEYSPPAWYTQGAGVVVAATVATAAAPFISAIATHFGNRLAGAIDEATRTAVRRFLRRQVGQEPGVEPRRIELRTEQGGRITFSPDLPVEALKQLPDLCAAEPPQSDIRLVISWRSEGWTCFGAIDGEFVSYGWDAESKRWAPAPLN